MDEREMEYRAHEKLEREATTVLSHVEQLRDLLDREGYDPEETFIGSKVADARRAMLEAVEAVQENKRKYM